MEDCDFVGLDVIVASFVEVFAVGLEPVALEDVAVLEEPVDG